MIAWRAWASDSLIRSHLKRSVGIFALPLIWVAVGSVLARGRDRLEWLGIFLVSIGAIMCAVHLLQMQHDGRLDQIRLSGRRPATFLASFAAAIAGPWTALGLATIIVSRLQGGVAQSLSETAVMIGFILCVIVAGLRIGLRQASVDPRLAIAALIAGGLMFVMIGESARQWLLQLRAASAPLLITIEIAFIAWMTRPLLLLIAHPAPQRSSSSWGARMPQRRWMLRWPGLFCGATSAFNAIVLIVIFAPLVILIRLFLPAPPESLALYGPPLLIGIIAVSILSREDAISGRLEMFRQSAMHPSRTALEMALGLWAPFVVVSAVLALLTWALFGVTRLGILVAVVGFALAAPLPVIEGWSRYWTLTYMMPLVMTWAFIRDNWTAVLVVSALHWYAIPHKFANPDAAVVTGWRAVAAAAMVAAALGVTPSRSGAGVVGMTVVICLMATSPLLVDVRATRLQRWWGPVAVGLASGMMALAGAGVSAGLSIGLAAALTWIGASRIAIVLRTRPVAQAMTRLVVLALAVMIVVVLDLIAWADVVNPWLLVPMGAGVCVTSEVAVRIAARLGRAGARPATPPA